MWKRVRQFAWAWRARITLLDRAFITEHLSIREQELFYGMSVQDQFHCRRVATDIIRLSAGCSDADSLFLVRCALLHDVGRRQGDVSTLDKIIAVLMHSFMPRKARAWAQEGRGNCLDNLRHALYVYYFHPQRGVKLLRDIGTENELLEVIKAHHEPFRREDRLALNLLRLADDLN